MNTLVKAAIIAAVGTVVGMSTSNAANAGSYQFTVTTGLASTIAPGASSNPGFFAQPGALTTNGTAGTTATATFTYTGGLSFSVFTAPDTNAAFGFSAANISNYIGSGTVSSGGTQVANFSSVSTFLTSSADVSGYAYGSFYTIGLGDLAGGTVLAISHDDGASVYENGVRIGSTVSGPTSNITNTVVVAQPGPVTLYYARENGTPSILQVAVPEPASLMLMGAGLLGAGLVRRKRG